MNQIDEIHMSTHPRSSTNFKTINPKNSTPRHIIFKLLKNKETIQSCRKEVSHHIWGTLTEIDANISSETKVGQVGGCTGVVGWKPSKTGLWWSLHNYKCKNSKKKRKETKVGQKAADDIFKVLKIKTIMQEFYNEGEIKTFLNKR